MRAIVQNAYGGPDVLKLTELDKPAFKENQVLIRMRASSVNAGDDFSMRGSPWAARLSVGIPKPENPILGWDVAGIYSQLNGDSLKCTSGRAESAHHGSAKASRLIRAFITSSAADRYPAPLQNGR